MLKGEKITSFKELYEKSVMGKQPYRQCQKVCPGGDCQYRYLLETLLEDSYYQDKFTTAINEGGPEMWSNLRDVCMEAAIEFNPLLTPDKLWVISGCFVVQKTYSLEEFSPQHIEIVLGNILGDPDVLE
jgi:hypothetical protein